MKETPDRDEKKRFNKKRFLIGFILFVWISHLMTGCGSFWRMHKGVVRPFEATVTDFQMLHSAMTEPPIASGDFRPFLVMIALPDFPVAVISDIILLPKDLWQLNSNYPGSLDFRISGTVTDINGKPLNNAKISIDGNRNSMVYPFDNYEKVVNGKFELHLRNLESLSLTFHRSGYCDRQFFIFPDDEIFSGFVKNNEFVWENCDIKFRRVKNIAKLLEYEDDLEFSVDKKAKVISLNPSCFAFANRNYDLEEDERGQNTENCDVKGVDAASDSSENTQSPMNYTRLSDCDGEETMFDVKNIYDVEHLPPSCIYFVPLLDENKRIATKNIYPAPYDRTYFEIYPEKLFLKFSNLRSSFKVVTPKKMSFERIPEDLDCFSEAPKNGYLKKISVDPFDLQKGDKVIYFYFRIDGRYGKGMIDGFDYEPNSDFKEDACSTLMPRDPKGVLKLRLKLYLNPVIGDRNLYTWND